MSNRRDRRLNWGIAKTYFHTRRSVPLRAIQNVRHHLSSRSVLESFVATNWLSTFAAYRIKLALISSVSKWTRVSLDFLKCSLTLSEIVVCFHKLAQRNFLCQIRHWIESTERCCRRLPHEQRRTERWVSLVSVASFRDISMTFSRLIRAAGIQRRALAYVFPSGERPDPMLTRHMLFNLPSWNKAAPGNAKWDGLFATITPSRSQCRMYETYELEGHYQSSQLLWLHCISQSSATTLPFPSYILHLVFRTANVLRFHLSSLDVGLTCLLWERVTRGILGY